MVISRSCSSLSRSGFIPVSALTSVDLPWSTCPAVPITRMGNSEFKIQDSKFEMPNFEFLRFGRFGRGRALDFGRNLGIFDPLDHIRGHLVITHIFAALPIHLHPYNVQ